MLNHVPSGSKSSASGLATGCAAWNALRFAIILHVPFFRTRITPFGMFGTPCQQPAPARSAYSLWPRNPTLETPLTRLPVAAVVWLDGSPLTTVFRTPLGVTFEIRPPRTGLFVLPVYGAAAPDAWVHVPTVEWEPPRPPSATYRSPSGPNVRPRGLLKPVAKTLTWAVACVLTSAARPLATET